MIDQLDQFVTSKIGDDPDFFRNYAFFIHAVDLLQNAPLNSYDDNLQESLLNKSKIGEKALGEICDRHKNIPREVFVSVGSAYREAFCMEMELDHPFFIVHAMSANWHFGCACGLIGAMESPPMQLGSLLRRINAREGAVARHQENRTLKAEVFAHLDANPPPYRGKDKAAESIAGKLVPVSFRTARKWIDDWEKLRSAGRG